VNFWTDCFQKFSFFYQNIALKCLLLFEKNSLSPLVVKSGPSLCSQGPFSFSLGPFYPVHALFYSVRPFSSRQGLFMLNGALFQMQWPPSSNAQPGYLSCNFKPFGQSGPLFNINGAPFHPMNLFHRQTPI